LLLKLKIESAVLFISIVASPQANGSQIGMPKNEEFEYCQTPAFIQIISEIVPIIAPTRKKMKSL